MGRGPCNPIFLTAWEVIIMTGMLRVPRSRGALSGVILVLLGAWGALIPFIGPYFHFAYTPDSTWIYNTSRLWLEILPGAATLVGGLIVLTAATRPIAVFGACLAAVSGAWFVVGMPLSTLWTVGGVAAAGSPVGGTIHRAVEQVGFFAGLGAVIIFFAALALGRFSVVGHREVVLAAAEEDYAAAEQARTERESIGRDEAAARSATERFSVHGSAGDPGTTQPPVRPFPGTGSSGTLPGG